MCINSRYRQLVQSNNNIISRTPELYGHGHWRVFVCVCAPLTYERSHRCRHCRLSATIMYYVLPITTEGSTHTHTRTPRKAISVAMMCTEDYFVAHRRTTAWRNGQRVCAFDFFFLFRHRMRGKNARVVRRAMTTTAPDAKTRRYKLFLVDGFCFWPADIEMSSTTWWGCPCARRVHRPSPCSVHLT